MVLPERELLVAGLTPLMGDCTKEVLFWLKELKDCTSGLGVDIDADFGFDNGPFSRS